MMTRIAPALKASVAEQALAAVLPPHGVARALVLFPKNLEACANALAQALRGRGVAVEVQLTEEITFRDADLAKAAAGWVPPPASGLPELLLLFGGQPWRASFEGDYRVGIQAMTHREALLAAGQLLLFVDWPHGARKDAEVDLSAGEVGAIFERAITIDYQEMRQWNAELLEELKSAQEIRVRCPHGTDLSLSVGGRRFIGEDCILGPDEPDVYLPGGEVYVAAVEESAEGSVAFHHVGAPRIATFERGILQAVVDAQGARDAELEEELGCGTEPLCEFGVGTNSFSPPWQIGTLYEKCAGTIHVAVGGNHHFGGERQSPRHMDLVVRDPTVLVDGRPLKLPRADWRE